MVNAPAPSLIKPPVPDTPPVITLFAATDKRAVLPAKLTSPAKLTELAVMPQVVQTVPANKLVEAMDVVAIESTNSLAPKARPPLSSHVPETNTNL